jgi:hypothetical protein
MSTTAYQHGFALAASVRSAFFERRTAACGDDALDAASTSSPAHAGVAATDSDSSGTRCQGTVGGANRRGVGRNPGRRDLTAVDRPTA